MPTDVPEPPADVAFARRAAYVEPADALLVADLHVGRDRQSDVQLPLDERGDVLERLRAALERFGPREVVVAGDLLHSFGHLPGGVAETLDVLAGAVEDACADLVVTRGNHDGLVPDAVDAHTPDEHRLTDGTLVCHGHERPEGTAERYVVGHDHPAITIEGRKHPCFLYGEGAFRGGDVLVLPAFSRLARGTAVDGMTAPDFMSPVTAAAAGTYRPVVYDADAGEALAFPPLAALREHL